MTLIPDRPGQGLAQEPSSPSEDNLDELLVKVEQKKAKKEQEQRQPQPDAVAVFRTRMRQVYQPIFEELAAKYSAKNIHMELDAEEFLGGGSNLRIRLSYGELSLDLEGTVMRNGVAFYIIRGVRGTKGAVVSGPMLRIRNLSAEDFREFLVEHLSTLIKDALRQA